MHRISEEILFGLMMMGPLGALLGMILCCHKTRKYTYWIRVILCLSLHCYLFLQFIYKKHEMMTNPGALGIDNIETPTDSYTNMDSLDDEIMPEHPEL